MLIHDLSQDVPPMISILPFPLKSATATPIEYSKRVNDNTASEETLLDVIEDAPSFLAIFQFEEYTSKSPSSSKSTTFVFCPAIPFKAGVAEKEKIVPEVWVFNKICNVDACCVTISTLPSRFISPKSIPEMFPAAEND